VTRAGSRARSARGAYAGRALSLRPKSTAGRLARVLLLGLSLGLGLALAEGGLVLAGRYAPDPVWYPGDHVASTTMSGSGVFDAGVGWKLAPGTVRETTDDFDVTYTIGADGWRETPGGDPQAGRTAVFVGDSYTFGTGVGDGETFAAGVGRLPGWRSVNLGMAGFGIDQMWQALALEGRRHHPDLVVASFVLDDLDRSLTAYRYRNGWIPKPTFVLESGRLVPRGPEHSPGRLVRWFERRTHVSELWRRLAHRLELATGLGGRWKLNRALFAALRDTARSQGAELLVVFIPYADRWEPTPMLAEAFRELEVLFLDLGTLSVEDPGALFFARDPHLNVDGHAFVARSLTELLVRAGLVARGS